MGRLKRQKVYRKTMEFYRMHFGVQRPYKVLLDGKPLTGLKGLPDLAAMYAGMGRKLRTKEFAYVEASARWQVPNASLT